MDPVEERDILKLLKMLDDERVKSKILKLKAEREKENKNDGARKNDIKP